MDFVATTIVRSEDGVTFNKETRIQDKDREEGKKLKKNRKGPLLPVGKSLAEQLKENADKKDAEWKEQNNPFRPPPSMTDEEAQFLAEKEEEEKRKALMDANLAEEAAAEFKTARLSEAVKVKPAEELPRVTGLFESLDSQEPQNKETRAIAVVVQPKKSKKKRKKSSKKKSSKKQKNEEGASALSLLAGYDED
mmetsp:Transcript_12966/g.18126  ORF Transcript_12966/g.18126 Transcript_12966/m.18126 type:complete len:194 (+) Transcript_12966:83-664(+)